MCILNLFWQQQQLLPHKAVYCVIMLRCVVFKKGKKNGDEIKFIFDSKIHMCSRHKIFDYHRSWLDGGNTPVGLLRKATKCLVLFGSLVSPVTS